MARLVFGQNSVHRLEHFGHAVGRKDATDAEAVDGLGGAVFCGFGAKVVERTTLDDGIEVLLWFEFAPRYSFLGTLLAPVFTGLVTASS